MFVITCNLYTRSALRKVEGSCRALSFHINIPYYILYMCAPCRTPPIRERCYFMLILTIITSTGGSVFKSQVWRKQLDGYMNINITFHGGAVSRCFVSASVTIHNSLFHEVHKDALRV